MSELLAEVVPTKKGLGLKPTKIGSASPGLDAVVPCCMQSDHTGQSRCYSVLSVILMETGKQGDWIKKMATPWVTE